MPQVGSTDVCLRIRGLTQETSWEWQYDLVRYRQAYERMKQKQHPVGMTATWGSAAEVRAGLDASPAAWVSYLFDAPPPKGQEAFDVNDPFVADGRKVSLLDSDHWFVKQIRGNPSFGREWVWKSFCRGHNPILMEHLPPLSAVLDDLPFAPEDPGYVASRKAMGQTRRFAERMNLAAMAPSPALASTRYCLADPGKEYLIYLPSGGTVTVDLSAAQGELAVEWFDPVKDKTVAAGAIRGGARREFKAPLSGAAVLYLAVRR